MIEDRISGYLYNELFSEINEEKYTAFQSMAWSLIVYKKLLETAQLLSNHIPSGLSLCILYFLFHKGNDTSVSPQTSVQHLVYVSQFSCVFTNALITFAKLNVFLHSVTSMTQGSCRFLFYFF